ncbi:hypothetical protein ACWESM_12325 [Nocardia sp. NPDC003999]
MARKRPEPFGLPPVPAEALALANADGRFHRGGYVEDEPRHTLMMAEWRRWCELRRAWAEQVGIPRGRAVAQWRSAVAEAKRQR